MNWAGAAPNLPERGTLSAIDPRLDLRQRYRRVVLLSHVRHLDRLDPDADDQLVISTDWLAWRRWTDAGRAGLHFDALIADWPEEMGDPATHHQRACEWVYVDGRDVTLFRGVSLGKQFNRAVSLFSLHFARAWHGLDRLCRRFGPEEIVLLDLRPRPHLFLAR